MLMLGLHGFACRGRVGWLGLLLQGSLVCVADNQLLSATQTAVNCGADELLMSC